MTGSTPAGWPDDLVPPEADDFQPRAVAWLLDRLPPEYRTDTWVRSHPALLALVSRRHAQERVVAAREAYREARVVLRDAMPADGVEGSLAAIERFGSQFVRSAREVDLVGDALLGRRWRAKL